MNQLARSFDLLSSAWQQDASSDLVDTLASHFAAMVAAAIYRHKTPQLLAVLPTETAPRLENLDLFLRSYGLVLFAQPLNRSSCLLGVKLADRRTNRELTGKVRAVKGERVMA